MSETYRLIEIEKMKMLGFAVRGVPERGFGDGKESLAACSTFEELIDWLQGYFGAETSEDYYRRVVAQLDAHRRVARQWYAKSVDPENLPVTKIDDQSVDLPSSTMDGAPTTVRVKPNTDPAIDELRAELAGRMGEARADPAFLAGDIPTGPEAPTGSGPGQAAESERDRIIAGLTPNQEKVFDVLQLEMLSAGDWFSLTKGLIARRAGLSPDTVPSVVGALEAKGLIELRRRGTGKPILYRLDVDEGAGDDEK